MELDKAEALLGVILPKRHQRAMLDESDPIHGVCDFLVPESPYELLRWVGVNESLHAADQWNRWPKFLVAFASNGCGDYFAYDTRVAPPKIVYVDPNYTVDENLLNADGFAFQSFDAWYEMKVG